MIALRLTIHGKVQRVFYRDWTVRNARELGLTGWVMNNPEGTVSALLQGDAETVAAMIARMQSGPPAARVERIHQQEHPVQDLPDFQRR